MEWVRPTANFLQSLTLRAFADWQVEGRENVPPMGPLIIVANHQSNFDPPLLSTSLPRKTSFLAKSGIFRGPLAYWFLRSYGAFPVDRDRADLTAYRWALKQLDRDGAVVVFPEGTRNPGGMKKARDGVVRLALKTQAPLLPVGISGTERLGTVLRIFNPTGKIWVKIGSVFSLPSVVGTPNKEVLQSLSDMVMLRIAALLPPSYRGTYQITPSEADEAPDRTESGVQESDAPLA